MTGRRPPDAFAGQRVIGEPRQLRHELAWTIELPDGRRAVIAQLAPELAAEPALRRRWVVDMERLAALPVSRLAPTLAIGPAPDPRAPDADPPWRARLDPDGAALEDILARAPLPIDEVLELGARVAEAVQTFHAAGAVLRDLDPRSVVIGRDGLAWFTDVGQARLAILSSRTASSLLLESSPYAAPEALLQTTVDARADVYSLGVVLWRALTGRVPFEASLVGARGALPALTDVRADAPRQLAILVARCLERTPDARPLTARDVATALRGRGADVALVVARATCQACGAAMRVGLRLCLACGKQAVQFHRAVPGDPEAQALVLERAKDDATFLAGLHEFFATVADTVPRLNFVVGDVRMYSKSEIAQRHRLPAVLIANLEPATGKALATRLKAGGYRIRTTTVRAGQRARRVGRGLAIGGGAGIALSFIAFASGAAPLGAIGLGAALFVGIMGLVRSQRASALIKRAPLAQLRAAPAALPAGDALVATIAAALTASKSPDVRARLEELALLVQRLADARAELAARSAPAAADAERITAPVRPLVDLACTTAAAIEAIDHQLTTLNEGAMMRALARADARHEPAAWRHDLLTGLDTLRQLEDERAQLFGRLLEISSLLRTAVTLGLQQASTLHSDDIDVAHAFAALDE